MAKRSDYLYDYIGSYRLSSELSGIILFTAPLQAIEQLVQGQSAKMTTPLLKEIYALRGQRYR